MSIRNTVTMRPRLQAIQQNFRAFADASRAPATSPAASFEVTCAARAMATMPSGRQQQSGTRIDWLGQFGIGVAGGGTPKFVRGGGTYVVCEGGGGGGTVRGLLQLTQMLALSRFEEPQFG